MACINADTRDFWNQLAKDLDGQRPRAGKFVEVTGGRKHKGKRGHVVRHELSRFGDHYRYGSDASHHMRDMTGREGWRVLVQCGLEQFWCDASKVTVTSEFCSGCGRVHADCECKREPL
jgi:hypothetical protein